MPIDLRRRWHLFPGLAFLFCALLVGCGLFFTPPTVAIQNVSLKGMDGSGLELELSLAVTNPNSFSLTLTGYNYDLFIAALPVTQGGSRHDLVFKAEKTTAIRLPVRLPYAALLEILKRKPDPDQLPYRLVGGLQVDTPLGERVITVDREGSFAIPPHYRPGQWLQGLQGILDDFVVTR